MSHDDNGREGTDDRDGFKRRHVLQTAASIGLLGGTAAGRTTYRAGGNGDGGNGGGGDGGGGGSSDPADQVAVTLVTGQTVYVTGDRDEREFSVDADEPDSFHVAESDDGTYVVPTGADLDRYGTEFFNVDFLIEQGMTDAETDEIPVILRLAAGVSGARGAAAIRSTGGFTFGRILESIDAVSGGVEKGRTDDVRASVLETEVVERVHLDTRYEALLDGSADAIRAPAARDEFDVDGSGVSIAIVDTGIDADHPDLGDRVVHERDFSGDGVADVAGHGTHVAGIAAGDGSASGGEYVGVAPGADLWNVKVLGDDGSGALSDVVAGIEHAVARGTDVINMSLGGPVQEDDPLEAAVDHAASEGVAVVVSAGNSGGHRSITSPGQAAGAITVGASDHQTGEIPYFSSGGPTPFDYRVKPDVVAPGSGITAAGSEDADEAPYTEKSGTSMSAPHVTGLAALLDEQDADRGPEGVRDSLVSTADPLEGEDVFMQGGGQVDAHAALDADLVVHDAVTDFGLYEGATTDEAEVTIENAGDDPIDVDVAATLRNVQGDERIDDNVSVSADALTIDPGETEVLTVEIATEGASGFNSGVLTFDVVDGATYRAVFGFVVGIEVVVEKIPHERSDGVANDGFQAWAHDGSFSHSDVAAFDADGRHSFLLFDDGGEFTFWSAGELTPEEGQLSGEPTLTVESNVTVDRDNARFTIDEGDTVPRALDTSRVDHHEPFGMREFNTSLYGLHDEGSLRYTRSFVGDFGLTTAHVSPIAEDDPTNVTSDFLMFPADEVGEYALDSPVVYHLLYGTRSIGGAGSTMEVDPDELAAERFEYHRNYDGQLYGFAPHVRHADQENYPVFFSIAFLADITADRVEQTWYRTERTVYDETWYDDGSFVTGNWRIGRMVDFVPERGGEYRRRFNREPLFGRASEWTIEGGALDLRGHWYVDQADEPFLPYAYDSTNENRYAVSVDGETVDEGTGIGHSFAANADVDPGSAVEVSMNGNTLVGTSRGTTTVTDYDVTYDPGATNVPPRLETVDVAGLNAFNEVPAGYVAALVTTSPFAADLVALYAASGTVEASPFDGGDGWREATVVPVRDGRYAALLDVSGYAGRVDLAFAATDADGNRVRSTAFEALTVTDGAELAAPIDVRPRAVNPGSAATVPVLIEATDGLDPHRLDVDTLRFGAADAVHAGDGAAPVRVQRLGNGDLQAHFRARDAGFDCDRDVAAAQLVGELVDGARLSGVDVVRVQCR